MINIAGHSPASALSRMLTLWRGIGAKKTIVVLMSVLEDRFLRVFDRLYGVQTSRILSLHATSVERSTADRATRYAPVNAWALRRLFRTLKLPKSLRFVDIGSGLGRACLLASEYGFAHVTGIDIVPEFCQLARKNAAAFRSKVRNSTPIDILNTDALEYSRTSSDDVFFMYKPFTSSSGLLDIVLDNLERRAKQLERDLTIIYTERFIIPESDAGIFERRPAFIQLQSRNWMGQMFWVYQCRKSSIDGPVNPTIK